MAEILSTLSPGADQGTPANGGERYQTFAAWEAGQQADLTGNDNTAGEPSTSVLDCYTGTYAQTNGSANITGWITNATSFITVKAAAGSEHGGVQGQGAYFRDSGFLNSQIINIEQNYTVLKGICVENRNNGYGSDQAIRAYVQNLTVTQCVLTAGSGYAVTSFSTPLAGGTVTYSNNLINQSNTGPCPAILRLASYVDLNIFNNTVWGGQADGIQITGPATGVRTLTNNAVLQCAGSDITIENANTSTFNATEDSTGQVTGLSTSDFVAYPTDMNPAQSGLLDGAGSSPPVLSVDIVGATRNDPDDIGAYAIAGSGPIDSNLLEGGPFTTTAAATAPSNVDAGGPYTGEQSSAITINATFAPGTGANPTELWTIDSGGTGTFGDATSKDTTFTPDAVGPYVLRFTASNDVGSDFDTANLTSEAPAGAPSVDAGGPYSGDQNTAIALNATVTPGTDPSPTLLWTIQSGGTGTFSDASIEDPTFTPDDAGAYVLKLAVTANDWPEVSDTANLTSNAVATTVQLMLHGGYTEGTSTIIDSSPFNRTVRNNAPFAIYQEDSFAFKDSSIGRTGTGGSAQLWQGDVSWGSSFTVEGFSRVFNGAYTADVSVAKNYDGSTYPGGTNAFKLSISNENMELLWNGFTRWNAPIPVGTNYEQFYWAFVFDNSLQQFRLYMGIKGGNATQQAIFNANTSPNFDDGWAAVLGHAPSVDYIEEVRITSGAALYNGTFPVPTAQLDPQATYTPPSNVNAGGPYSGDQDSDIAITATYDSGDAAPPTLLWTSDRPGEGDFGDASAASTIFTPTGSGTYILTFTVTSHAGTDSDTATLTSNTLGEPITFTGNIDNYTLIVNNTINPTDISGNWSGTLIPFTFTSIGTALPPGLTLSSAGVISGTPTVVGVTQNCQIQGEDTGSNTAPSNFFDINVIDTPTGLGGIQAGTQGKVRRIWAGEDPVGFVFVGDTLVWTESGIVNTVNGSIASIDTGESMSLDISGWDIKDGDMILCGAVNGGGLGYAVPANINPGDLAWDDLGDKEGGAGGWGGGQSWRYIDSTRAVGLTSIDIVPSNNTQILTVEAIAIHIRGCVYPHTDTAYARFSNLGTMADPGPVTINNSNQLVICAGCVFSFAYENTISQDGFEMVDALPKIVFSETTDVPVGPFDPPAYTSTPPDPVEPDWASLTVVFDRT